MTKRETKTCDLIIRLMKVRRFAQDVVPRSSEYDKFQETHRRDS